MSHFPYNEILIPCELLPGMLWRFPLRACWNPAAAATCYVGQGVLSSEEWDIMTLMDKCCYLQAGLILIGVTLPHKPTLLFVCLLPFFMPSHLVPRSVMCAVSRQWEGLLWKASNWEKECLVHKPTIKNQRQSPRLFIEELNLSDYTSWVLGQWLRRFKLRFSAADAKAQFPHRALAMYPSMKVHSSLDFSLLRKDFQFHEIILHSGSKQLCWRQLAKNSCRVSSADELLLSRPLAALKRVWGVLLWLSVSWDSCLSM